MYISLPSSNPLFPPQLTEFQMFLYSIFLALLQNHLLLIIIISYIIWSLKLYRRQSWRANPIKYLSFKVLAIEQLKNKTTIIEYLHMISIQWPKGESRQPKDIRIFLLYKHTVVFP